MFAVKITNTNTLTNNSWSMYLMDLNPSSEVVGRVMGPRLELASKFTSPELAKQALEEYREKRAEILRVRPKWIQNVAFVVCVDSEGGEHEELL